ncbi:UNVERIFIED_CONTAM: hypothetical protein HDU68_003472, partial [Siphonaria sp. JEL0065]
TCIPPACLCPSFSPPGGLAVADTPQFVLITFDDWVTAQSYQNVTPIFQGLKNPNGCAAKGTFFTEITATEPAVVTRLYAEGHEIADHTFSHPHWSPPEEVAAMIDAADAFFGVPRSAIKGFRAPFLQNTYAQLVKAQSLGIQWHSSGTNSVFKQPWPYTLDNGFAYKCNVGQNCSVAPTPSLPGFWDIPMGVYYPNTSYVSGVVQDPLFTDVPTTVAALKLTFDLHYNNGRTPFGLWYHAWNNYVGDMQNAAIQFIQTIQRQYGNNVWFVTGSQLIEWMKNPVPISGMANFLSCNQPVKHPMNGEYFCDGLDDNGDGLVDEGVASICNYPDGTDFRSCYGCPTTLYTVSNPAPPAGCSPLDPYGANQTTCPPLPLTVNNGVVPPGSITPTYPTFDYATFDNCYDSTYINALPVSMPRSYNTTQRCIERCYARLYPYASISNGKSCKCGFSPPQISVTPTSNCLVPCAADPTQ